MNRKRINIRASSVPARLICPSFGHTDKPYNPESAPAQQGTAAHTAIEHYIKHEEEPDFESLNLETPLADPEETRPLYYMARAMYDGELLPMFTKSANGGAPVSARARMMIETEKKMECKLGTVKLEATGEIVDVCLTGHADIVAATGADLFVWDWKFGRETGKAHMGQTAAYGALAVASYGWPESGVVTVGEAHPRHGEAHECTQVLNRVYLSQFKRVLLASVQSMGAVKQPHPDACKYCPARIDCEQWPMMLREAAALSMAIKGEIDDGKQPTAQQFADNSAAVSTVAYAAKLHGDTHRTLLESQNAFTKDTAQGGHYLAQVGRKSLDARRAWPVLQEAGFSQDDIAGVITMTQSAVKKVYMGKQEAGEKKAAWEQLSAKLNEAQAIKEKTTYRKTKV